MRRTLPSLVLHGFMIASLLFSAVLVPAQMVRAALHVDGPPATTMAMDDMPCHDMVAPAQPDPCKDCQPATCDMAACLASACLPPMIRLVAMPSPGTVVIPWRSMDVPTERVDTLLRPPIA
jgi:hypothetical protein